MKNQISSHRQINTAYIGLGSNLENPTQQVETALKEINQIPDVQLRKHSSLYRNPAIGLEQQPYSQPDFINAVAELTTDLDPFALLKAMQELEQQHGRIRRERWGPRTLDCDLLLYNQQIIAVPQLTIPHPELKKRLFVLYPLIEIAPDLQFPDGTVLKDYCDKQLPRQLQKLENGGSGSSHGCC